MTEKIGVCLTCSYWDEKSPRTKEEVNMIGLCVQPQLKAFALIVSGSSACNHWKEQSDAGPAAKAYAEAQA